MTDNNTAVYMTAKELKRVAKIINFLNAEEAKGDDQITLAIRVADANAQDLGYIRWEEFDNEYVFEPEGWNDES